MDENKMAFLQDNDLWRSILADQEAQEQLEKIPFIGEETEENFDSLSYKEDQEEKMEETEKLLNGNRNLDQKAYHNLENQKEAVFAPSALPIQQEIQFPAQSVQMQQANMPYPIHDARKPFFLKQIDDRHRAARGEEVQMEGKIKSTASFPVDSPFEDTSFPKEGSFRLSDLEKQNGNQTV